MLISRGLRVLLLGLSATASVLDRRSLPPKAGHQVQISREPTRARVERSHPSQSEQGPRWASRQSERKRLQSREVSCSQVDGADYTCPDGFTCCLSATGEPDCCPVAVLECAGGNCTQPLTTPAAAGASTVFITRTLTSTITLFTGSPTTSIVRATKTIVLTLLDPTELTETTTVTATSLFGVLEASGSINGSPETTNAIRSAGDGTNNQAEGETQRKRLGRRQEQTVTSTVTAEVFTTVLRQSVVVGTLTDTVFSTKFAAPNAVTTVFVTTTVFVPAGAIPTTEAPGIVPTAPGGAPVPAPTTTAVIPPPSSAGTGLPSSTLGTSTSRSSTSLPSTMSTSAEPSMTTMTMMTMLTTPLVPSTTTGGPVPTLQPAPSDAPRYTTTQIIGIAVGSFLGFLLLVLLAFGLRRVVRNRRSAQAQMRQQLPPPVMSGSGGGTSFAAAVAPRLSGPGGGRGGAGAAALATNGSTNSDNSAASAASNHSMLTGEGEVRIVIRPAPKRRTQSSQLWPMPPGHRGRTYSLFVEETTTGETTPQDPGEWSIASEKGSVDGNTGRGGNNNNTTIYSTLDPAAERASGSGGRPSTSIFSAGWDRETSLGARSDFSYPGLGTLLTPPPAWHGHAAERGWPRPLDPAEAEDDAQQPEQQQQGRTPGRSSGGPSDWYPSGSLGIGKAV
ncbi:hypothetical protein B0T16DRAFT_192122 [Cercophora newfieldiana]|uniref:Uncharacterized protein n=1 Tax=Cercophora newfieldiana TaxID=92897 RepID=A0AA40CNZ1_9PEZI|nr:hypothetical protein B0T16DRAFT_192122 [Cercophora newfieldiana]